MHNVGFTNNQHATTHWLGTPILFVRNAWKEKKKVEIFFLTERIDPLIKHHYVQSESNAPSRSRPRT